MHSRILLLALALLILSSIIAGGLFYVAGNKTTILPVPEPSGQIQGDGKSGVFGKVLIGPTCPVVFPGQTGCEDKPLEAEIIVLASDNTRELGKFKSDAQGNYRIALPAGTYTLKPAPRSTQMTLGSIGKPEIVTIEENQFIEINLYYDSGIR